MKSPNRLQTVRSELLSNALLPYSLDLMLNVAESGKDETLWQALLVA